MGSSSLRLHPWRDGLEHCLRLLEGRPPATTNNGNTTANHDTIRPKHVPTVAAIRNGQFTPTKSPPLPANIRSVDVCFHQTDYQPGISTSLQWVELFDAIGRLPRLESLMVRVTLSNSSVTKTKTKPMSSSTALSFPILSKQGIVPLEALTTALSSAPHLQYLTLIGVPILADDYDMNGWSEVVRIHPSLQSMVLKDCSFGSKRHLEQLQQSQSQSQPSKQPQTPPSSKQKQLHLEVLNCQVVDISQLPDDDSNPNKPWYQSLVSICLFPMACCILVLAILLVLEYQDDNSWISSRLVALGLRSPPPPPTKVPWWIKIFTTTSWRRQLGQRKKSWR